jgi:hypothetical protein
MQIVEVTNRTLIKAFLNISPVINATEKRYIRPLDKDIEQVFDPEKNKAFRHGEVIRWVLKDDNGAYIGKIAAFVNKKYKTKGDEGLVGGIGFFDCINDQAAANLLFDTAKAWLAEKGAIAMDGPINFGERDRWWGLLIDGFEQPLYGMNYNPPYYKNLFETYGFEVFFNQYTYGMNVMDPLSPKLFARHKIISEKGGFSARINMPKILLPFTTTHGQCMAA